LPFDNGYKVLALHGNVVMTDAGPNDAVPFIYMPDLPKDAWGPRDDAHFRYAVARIRSFQSDNPQWQLPVVLTIRDRGGEYDVVGLQRPRQDPKIKIKTPKQKPRNRELLTKSNEVRTSLTQ
jgi:hypothetical protein